MALDIEKHPYTDSAQLFDLVAGQAWAMFYDSGLSLGRKPPSASHRYDVLAIQPRTTIVSQDALITLTRDTASESLTGDPLRVVQQELDYLNGPDTVYDGYVPGAFGYFSYDLARQFEQLPTMAHDDECLPEMALGIYEVIVVIDHLQQTTSLITWLGSEMALALRQQWRGLIKQQLTRTTLATGRPLKATKLVANQSPAEYRENFFRVRDYTVAGDCYQVNLTLRFASEVSGSSWATYQRLREASPAPYGAYLHLPFAEVLSNSPESFIQCRGGRVSTKPIKGTRARDHNNRENDRAIAQQLTASAKDRAENLMIVDLMRNDLSRSCELGSVQVPSLFALHSFANVHHLISTITGRLQPDLHALDLLRSCFPGGSITGAPKIRAMEIIEELEPHRRGLYCGSIAYIGMDGSLETNIAIRTIVVKDGIARFAAGGGLVIDSDPDEEYQELLDKASMMRASLIPNFE